MGRPRIREGTACCQTDSIVYDYVTTLLLTTYRVCDTGFTSWLRGAFSRNDPERRSKEWRPTLRREPQRGRSGPRPLGLMAWRGQSLRLRFHCREPASWVRIRKPPRWSAERGPGRPGTGWSRVAGATERMSAPVGAPSTPHRGDGIAAVATAAGVKAPWARRRTRKRRHMRRDGQTRAQQRAAGTNNTALFDIVNRE